MDYGKIFKKLEYDMQKIEQIVIAHENGVPEAIPDMLKVKDDHRKMREIRLAYKNGVPEAVPDMLDYWWKMYQIRVSYEELRK